MLLPQILGSDSDESVSLSITTTTAARSIIEGIVKEGGWARPLVPCHICHRDRARFCHIPTGIGTTPATSAPGLDRSLLSQASSGISLQWTSLQGNAAYLDWVAENVNA